MKSKLGTHRIRNSILALGAAGALTLGAVMPAQAATTYRITISHKTTKTSILWGLITSCPRTSSVNYYAAASAQMKTIVMTENLKSGLSGVTYNKTLYAATNSSSNSNIKSQTFSVPSADGNMDYLAKATAKFTTKGGALTTKSSTSKWGTPTCA